MFAPYWGRAVALALTLALAASGANAFAQTRTATKASDSGRPAFFVDWGVSGAPPGLTARPAPKKGQQPEYPSESVRRRETGTTSLQACISVDGHASDVHVTKSSGFTRLDDATVAWTKTAQFTPAAINGDPVNVCGFPFDYSWKLQD